MGRSRRDDYHGLGISLIESLIPEFDNSAVKAAASPLDDIDTLFGDLSAEAGSAAAMEFTSLQPAGLQEFTLGANSAQLQTPAATHDGSPSSNGTQTTTSPAAADGSEQQSPAGQQQKVEADSCCEICGYRPKGDPQWFKGSMAKHKKLQHSTEPPKIYKCPFPGCTSQYKNRPDNLRQHQIEKNHWVQGEEGTPRRPSKRKKVAAEEE